MAQSHPNGQSPRFCDYEGSDYRTAFWEGRGREYEDRAERIALRRLLPPGGGRIIDIGAGFGRLVDLYAAYDELVLMDYSRSHLEYARQHSGAARITCVAANIYQMPFATACFDAAVIVRVLHHLSDTPKALQAVRHILYPGATLVMEYANQRNLKAIVRYCLGRQQHNPFGLEPWEFAELNFDYHPAFVEGALREAGFRIERQLGVSSLRIGLLKRLLPAAVAAAADAWFQNPMGRLKLTPSVFVRARAVGEAGIKPRALTFCCPVCRGDLAPEPERLLCVTCGRRWSTAGGIYDFKQPLQESQ